MTAHRPAAIAVGVLLLAPWSAPASPGPSPDREGASSAPRVEAASSPPGWLGITGSPGVSVLTVLPGGPADEAGLMPGDLIVAVAGEPLVDRGALRDELSKTPPGTRLALSVLRGADELEIEVTLGRRPEAPAHAPGLPEPASPTDDVARAAGELRLKALGEEQRAFLGVRTLDLTEGLAAYFGLSQGRGVVVEHVFPDSGAAEAGLRAGDVILEVAGGPIPDMTELGRVLRDLSPSDTVDVAVQRDGTRKTFPVTLGRRTVHVWGLPVAPDDRALAEEIRRRTLDAEARRLEAEIERLRARLGDLRAGAGDPP